MILSVPAAQSFWDELEKIANLTTRDIHRRADELGIVWDSDKPGSQAFLTLSKRLTGKSHLDKMTPAELRKVYGALEKTSATEYYHGSRKKLRTLRKGSYVTPYKEDALSFAVPWSTSDLSHAGAPDGRPPRRLKFKGKPPRDHKVYLYRVKAPVQKAATNTGAQYEWNRVTTEPSEVDLVATIPSWKRALLEKTAAAGHWRKLKVDQSGHDQQGNPIQGRTWVKKKEFAPGIPASRAVKSIRSAKGTEVWNLAVQQHPAQRAGDHFDIRLVDPNEGDAHSFVTRKGEGLPQPGGRAFRVKQQPTHTSDYALKFEGEIAKGYGKTRKGEKVKHVLNEPVEVLQASQDFVRFNLYTGRGPQEFILTRDKKRPEDPGWFLINVTKTRDRLKDLPFSKPKYKEVKPGAIDFSDEDQVMAAKLDGGHNTFVLKKGQRPRIFSYRVPKERKTGAIEHSQKVESLYHSRVPASVHDTILRGELYARGEKGPVRAEIVGGMLNAGVWKSRELQKEHGKLRAAVFDVVKFRGKDMTNATYAEKLDALKEVQKQMPQFEIPDMAFTEEEKRALLDSIEKKLHPATHEGVILWPRHKPGRPIKSKFTVDHDVFVHSVTQAKGKDGKPKDEAGAIWYSLTPDGPPVAKMGTGFSSALRKDLWKRRDSYIGAVAKLTAERQTKRGAFTKARFQGWHLDKNPETFWAHKPITK
jgi:hypothetical protein